MKKFRILVVTTFFLSFLHFVSTSWADTYSAQVESVYWTNQGEATTLYHLNGTQWNIYDTFNGSPGPISPPYEIGLEETPVPTLTGSQALELSTLPYLTSYDVSMPNFGDADGENWLAISDSEFIVNFKAPPSPGLFYNLAIQKVLEEGDTPDQVVLSLNPECAPDGTITYTLSFSDENGDVVTVQNLDFTSIALRILVDASGGATASYFLNPDGDITDPAVVPWETLAGSSDLDSESTTAGRYGTFFNISATCAPPICIPEVTPPGPDPTPIPEPNVQLSIKKMKIYLKNGKFEIKGYLDVNDPDFNQLVADPQAAIGLLLQTGGTEDEPEFGIVAGELIQLKTGKNKLKYKSTQDKDD